MTQKAWLSGSRLQFVPIGVCTIWLGLASTAQAASEGEWCGKFWRWSEACDDGLECDVTWSFGAWSSGTCRAAERCGDGSMLICRRAELPCPEGQEREIVDGCYGFCVDSESCEIASCDYGDQQYPVGSGFPAADGCNSCSCQEDGTVICTLRACTCDYDQPDVTWVSRDPEECTRIDFLCVQGMQHFSNTCGCGCEPVKPCRVAGCSGQLCVPPEDEGVSTCEWTPAYACYADATCELQPDGACGWTPTDELKACLESAGQEQP